MRYLVFVVLTTICTALGASLSPSTSRAEDGFVSLFDGTSLKGWHISETCGHGNTKAWTIRDGAIWGTQDKAGNGGIILTDAEYGDFEVALEMNNDYVPDSGLFLRSTEKGQCYQAMIDYHPDGNLMGIYGEGLGGFIAKNFATLDHPYQIKELSYPDHPLPVRPELWGDFWKHGQWNTLRARVEGNPPTITTWINGVQIMKWSDKEKRLEDKGRIALQVHGGGDLTQHFVRYRNIRVKELAK